MLVITTSCVVSSRPYPETPPPLIAAPVPIPSVCAMPSLPRPPRPPKTIIPVLSCTLLLPPPEITNEGISVAIAANPCATGSDSMSSVFICVCRRVLCTSTIGLSPVTVTVSSSVPTRNSALTVDTKSAGSTRPSRTKVLKPGSLKLTL